MEHHSESAPKAKARKVRDELFDKIVSLSKSVTAQERATFDEIVARAKAGTKERADYVLTPALAALIFVKANGFNREWNAASGPKNAVEYARRMSEGQWSDWNGQGNSIGFYVNGDLADGQHRLSGAALANYTFKAHVTFGIAPDDVVTIDDGRARHASDHAELQHVKDAKPKATVIKAIGAWLASVKPEAIAFDSLRSEAETAAAIQRHDAMLTQALALGDKSHKECADPLFSVTKAGTLAGVLLIGGWPVSKIEHVLKRVQSGDAIADEGGTASPFFAAAKAIASRVRGKALKPNLQISLVVDAALRFERGEGIGRPEAYKARVEKQGAPNPAYPAVADDARQVA